jgi:hypothetical protein
MKDGHIQFEMLYALAASDQLTERELGELRDHCDLCTLCATRFREMKQTSEELFLMYALAEPGQRTPTGMRERFITRANRQGIQLTPHADQSSAIYRPMLFAVTLLVVAIAIASSHRNLPAKAVITPPPSTTIAGQQASSSQAEPRSLGAHSGHNRRGYASVAATAWRVNHESRVAPGSPGSTHIAFVMYSPQPRFSGYSIPAIALPESMSLLAQADATTRTNLRDLSSPGGRFGGALMQQDQSKFTYAFLLDNEKPLWENTSEFRQPAVQAVYPPNATQNFKVKLSEFHIP